MAFDRMTPDEIRLLTFDFSGKAPATATLSNPTVVVDSVVAGVGTIGDITLGTAAAVDLTVTVLASTGVDGNRYRLKAEADGSNGEHYEVQKDLPVSARAVIQ